MKNAIVFLFKAVSVFSLPLNLEVVSGQAAIDLTDQMVVETSDRAVLDWGEFSIAPNEKVYFQQPASSSSVLNRVIGERSSEIFGQLQSNGKVLLINPNGVLFGQGSQINTASLVASTLDIQTSAFLENRELYFAGDSKHSVINQGTIRTDHGDLLLIGSKVDNQGVLIAKEDLALVSTSEVLIQPEGKTPFYISINDLNDVDLENVFANLLPHHEDALFVYEDGDEVYLSMTSNSGNVRAKNISILGDQIILDGNTHIDASNEADGGTILIGGDFQGSNETIPNAKYLFTGEGVEISADSLVQGDGGRVVLWADDVNGFFGKISTKGGKLGGDGGWIEISSPKSLILEGSIDTSSTFGKMGKVLLDPTDVEISNAVNAGIAIFPSSNNYTFSGASANISVVSAPTLQSFLGAASVTINTNNGFGGVGNITVTDGFTWGATTSLSLIANNDININDVITSSGNNANLNLTAQNGDINISADILPTGDNARMRFVANNGNVNIVSSATQSARVELTGLYTGNAIEVTAPNGEFFISSTPMFRSHLHTRSLLGDTGNIVINTGSGLRMICNSTNANPSNVEIYSFRGDVIINTGDIYLEASEGSLVLGGSVQIVAGSDFSNNPLGGEMYITATNLFAQGSTTAGGRGSTNINSHQLLPVSQGNSYINISGDLQLLSGFADNVGAGISAENGGDLIMTVGGDCTLISRANTVVNNSNSPGISTQGGDVTLSVGGDLYLEGGNPTAGTGSTIATIGSIFPATVTVDVLGTTTFISGNPAVPSFALAGIFSFGGDIYLTTNDLEIIGSSTGGNAGFPFIMGFPSMNQIEVTSSNGISMDLGEISAVDILATAGQSFSMSNQSSVQAFNSATLFAGIDFSMASQSFIDVTGPVQIIVDNNFPSPFIGPGSFSIDATSFIDANGDLLSIYTARQALNSIDPAALLNGSLFVPGELFVDTDREVWCTYYPDGITTAPFTVFYKPCIQLAAEEATLIDTEILWKYGDLRPTWQEYFKVGFLEEGATVFENWFLRRRVPINQPKSWTDL